MFNWPKLELTDFERLFVRPYATVVTQQGKKKRLPGVLRRTYPLETSNNTDYAESTGTIQIARRTRVFGLTFSGDISRTRLRLTNATGTNFIVPDTRDPSLFPYITTLVAGTPHMLGSALGGIQPGVIDVNDPDVVYGIYSPQQVVPMLIEPNYVLAPNDVLRFEMQFDVAADQQDPTTWRFVNVGVHVWEFPGMGNADKLTAEQL